MIEEQKKLTVFCDSCFNYFDFYTKTEIINYREPNGTITDNYYTLLMLGWDFIFDELINEVRHFCQACKNKVPILDENNYLTRCNICAIHPDEERLHLYYIPSEDVVKIICSTCLSDKEIQKSKKQIIADTEEHIRKSKEHNNLQ